MEGKQLAEFLNAQFRAGNVGRGRVICMRGQHRLVIELKAAPAGVEVHTAKKQIDTLAEQMRASKHFEYLYWHKRGWNIRTIAAARKQLKGRQ